MQQVNLYQDELKTQKLNFSAMMLLQLSLVLIVILTALAGFRYAQLQQHQSSLIVMQQKQKSAQAELIILQTELASRKKDKSLLKTIAEKTKELTSKQKVLAILSQDQFGNTKGFVEPVTGLARQRIEGLWLTQIRIAEGGTDIALQGTTSNAALLPKYLQRLSAEKSFSGIQFQSLMMAREEKKKQWLSFNLKNIKKKKVASSE